MLEGLTQEQLKLVVDVLDLGVGETTINENYEYAAVLQVREYIATHIKDTVEKAWYERYASD